MVTRTRADEVKCCIKADYRLLDIIAIYWTFKRKFLLLDPYTSGANQHCTSWKWFSSFSSQGEPRCFIHSVYHHVQTELYSTCLSYWDQAYSWWELWDPVSILSCALPLQIAVQKAAQLSDTPGPGGSLESTGLPFKLRTIKWFLAASGPRQRRLPF